MTLAFITSSDTGTILLMGVDAEEEEYAILEVYISLPILVSVNTFGVNLLAKKLCKCLKYRKFSLLLYYNTPV